MRGSLNFATSLETARTGKGLAGPLKEAADDDRISARTRGRVRLFALTGGSNAILKVMRAKTTPLHPRPLDNFNGVVDGYFCLRVEYQVSPGWHFAVLDNGRNGCEEKTLFGR